MDFITQILNDLIGDNLAVGLWNIWQIVMVDIVLSADNALIIGLAAAGLAPELRKKAIFFGMAIAAGLRIFFTIITAYLLNVPFIRLIGAILLIYICWKLFVEIRDAQNERKEAEHAKAHGIDPTNTEGGNRTLFSALLAITIADVSMSLDNVLAVAEIASHNTTLLVFGLGLAIIMMAFFATMILKVLERFPIISWVGLAVLCWVAAKMLYKGIKEAILYVQTGELPGLKEGVPGVTH